MRVALPKLLEKLGVDTALSAYETRPWLLYDEAKKITCSAEVRMGPGAEDLEAEIQFLKDEGAEDSGDGIEDGKAGSQGQIMRMRAIPSNDSMWTPVYLRVKGKNYVNEIYDWEGKGCNFFRACIEAIQMGVLPDIDELIEKELSDDNMGGGGRGKIGRKSPKIKPAQLMGMNKKGF